MGSARRCSGPMNINILACRTVTSTYASPISSRSCWEWRRSSGNRRTRWARIAAGARPTSSPIVNGSAEFACAIEDARRSSPTRLSMSPTWRRGRRSSAIEPAAAKTQPAMIVATAMAPVSKTLCRVGDTAEGVVPAGLGSHGCSPRTFVRAIYIPSLCSWSRLGLLADDILQIIYRNFSESIAEAYGDQRIELERRHVFVQFVLLGFDVA